MKPSDKTPEMDELIKELFGIDRRKVIESDMCAFCGKEAKVFRDPLSAKEYSISGLCQKCQDETYGV
jgi:hypothetical protein